MRDEKAGVRRCDRLAAQLGELAQQLLLLPGDVGGRVDRDAYQEVAASPALDVRNTPVAQPEDPARLRAAGDDEILVAVERVERQVARRAPLG